MSLLSLHHCLFCKHLNPAGATFCNECGTQLSLQPCNYCGAVNDRAARNCQQCHLELTLPAPPQFDDSSAPEKVGKHAMRSTLNDSAAGAEAPATKPDAEPASSPAERFIESYDRPVRQNPDPAPSPDKSRQADRVVAAQANEAAPLWRKPHDEGAQPMASSEMNETLSLWHRLQNHGSEPVTSAGAGPTTKASRRKLYISASVLLLAIATAGTGYYLYIAQPAQLAKQQGRALSELAESAESAESATLVAPERPDSASPTVAIPSAEPARPAELAPQPAPANSEVADAAPPPVLAASSALLSARPFPPPDTPPDAAVPTRQEAPRSNACPPAVATLGLCDPGNN